MLLANRIDSRVRFALDDLSADQIGELKRDTTHSDPEYFRIKVRQPWRRDIPRTLSTWHVDRRELSVPRGALTRLPEDVPELADAMCDGDPALARQLVGVTHTAGSGLWPHQREIVDAIKGNQTCIIRSGTGSGKTTALLAAVVEIGLPALVIVSDGRLFEQWLERIGNELQPSIAVGKIGRGKFTIGPITVAMQQTLWRLTPKKRDEVRAAFGVVIADECHLFAARTFLTVIDGLPARYRVGASAQEKRRDGREFLLYDVFGRVVVDISQRALVDAGITREVEVRIIPTDFRADWYVQQRRQYSCPHGDVDHFQQCKLCGWNMRRGAAPTPNYHALLDEMCGDDDRQLLAVNPPHDESVSVMAQSRPVLLMSHRRAHCKELARYRSGATVLGGDADAESVISALRRGELRWVAGTVQAIGTGIDLPGVQDGVLATPIGNNPGVWQQLRGRFCRNEGTRDRAVLWYLWDRHVFGIAPLENMMRWNRVVSVLDGTQLVDAKEYLRRVLRNETKDRMR